jgi:hypothetical protein
VGAGGGGWQPGDAVGAPPNPQEVGGQDLRGRSGGRDGSGGGGGKGRADVEEADPRQWPMTGGRRGEPKIFNTNC